MPPDPLSGRALGDFIVRERIGEGGMGAVYRAVQPALEREAVIKVLHAHTRSAAEVVPRFLREARLASRLDHPYAAHIYAFGAEEDGLLWIAMELVRGTALDQILEAHGPIALDKLVPLLERICEVVQSAHEAGIVHRDLKPANVMVVARAGRLLPKLLDFGIAKVHDPGAGEPAVPGREAAARDSLVTGATVASSGRPAEDAPTEPGPSPQLLAALAGQPPKLTRDGTTMGSPHYMAPEQWVSPKDAGARTDQYALAVLAYEALIGRPPFDGQSLRDLARAHAVQPVPPVGAGFPPALDAVFQRALDKREANRFATVLEFAAAFREASGISPEAAALPQLDARVRDAFLLEGPQPIAEALAAHEAAKNLHQARDALWQVVRVVARFLGLTAIAARARIGSGRAGEAPRVAELFRTLHRRPLGEDEWLELARELARPFARRRDAYPVPELVSFFFEPDSEDPTPLAHRVVALLALRAEDVGGSESALRELLEVALAEVAGLLRGLAFLLEYPLVVSGGGRAERWTGLPRSPRAALPTRGPALADGQPVLLDREGAAAVSLYPLVQARAPTPGAPEELFLFDGRGRRGARLVVPVRGFEHQDEELWNWFRINLHSSMDDAPGSASRERAPYRGLAPFGAEDADLFFGREHVVEAFLNRLRVQPLLAVVGPSGAGKSSFVQAGVVPALPGGWRAITVRPGPSPLQSLVAHLDQLEIAGADLGERVRQDPSLVGVRLRRAAGDAGIVLVIDQLEELFTLCVDPAERAIFAEVVTRAARSAEDPVRVILTMRDDFLIRAEQLPALRDRIGQGLQLLATPAREDLLRILREPARLAGYEFEDAEMPDEMVQEVADQPGGLPLLSFTAAQLWELRDRQFKQLSRKAYRALEGVGGALARHAEATLAELAPEEQRLTREAFRHLVTAEGTRAVLSGAELRQLLGGGAHAETVVERLVGARLLVATEGEGSQDRIEVAHEALLSAWPRLVEWRRQDAEGARLRDQLRAAARQWQERGRPHGALWRDDALADLQRWRARHAGRLTDVEDAFAAASITDARRSTRRRQGALMALFVGLVLGVVALSTLNARTEAARRRASASAREARRQRQAAVSAARRVRDTLAAQYVEQGRQAFLGGDASAAFAYIISGMRLGAESPGLRTLVAMASSAHEALARTLRGHRGKVTSMDLSADGARVLSGGEDGTARLWDVGTGRSLATLSAGGVGVLAVGLSPDGARAVTGYGDGSARVWDVGSGRVLHVLQHDSPDRRVRVASFVAGGSRVLTAGNNGEVDLWDAETGRRIASLGSFEFVVSVFAQSADGSLFAVAGFDGVATVHEASTGRARATLRHGSAIFDLAFSPDGSLVATAGRDGVTRVWDARAGRETTVMAGHSDLVTGVQFSPDGRSLLTASRDRTAKLWDVGTGRLVRSFDGHRAHIETAVFDASGTRIVTASADRTALIWDVASGAPLAALEGHSGSLVRAEFTPDGSRVVTASWDGTVRLWDASRSGLVRALPAVKGSLAASAFSPSGDRVVTASDEASITSWRVGSWERTATTPVAGTAAIYDVALSPDGMRAALALENRSIRVLDLRSGRQLSSFAGHTKDVLSVQWSPDGRRLLSGSADGTARVWDPTTGGTLRVLAVRDTMILTARFDPSATHVATASLRGDVQLWDAATGREVRRFRGPAGGISDVEFSHDGARLVSTHYDGTVHVWEVATGRHLAELVGHTSIALAGVFSPDDELIATDAEDHTARLWDARSYRLLATLRSETASFARLSFSPDGTQLATPGADGVLRIWDVHRDRRSLAELEAFARCRVPVELREGNLVTVEPRCDAAPR